MLDYLINDFYIHFHNERHTTSIRKALDTLVSLKRHSSKVDDTYPAFEKTDANYGMLKKAGFITNKPNIGDNYDTSQIGQITDKGADIANAILKKERRIEYNFIKMLIGAVLIWISFSMISGPGPLATVHHPGSLNAILNMLGSDIPNLAISAIFLLIGLIMLVVSLLGAIRNCEKRRCIMDNNIKSMFKALKH